MSNQTCDCGHSERDHIYHEGACRPGYVCETACEQFRTTAVSTTMTRDERLREALGQYLADEFTVIPVTVTNLAEFGANWQREQDVQDVMDLLFCLRAIGGTVTNKDLIKLAKRMQGRR